MLTALLVTGCADKPQDRRAEQPQPTAAGVPIGPLNSALINAAGGELALEDRRVRLEVPPGALNTDVEVTIQPITNLAPGGTGVAYRFGPEGLAFALPVTLTFDASEVAGAVAELSIATQRASGYWVRAESQVRDEPGRTISALTTHLSDWALTVPPTATSRDLVGSFTLDQSIDVPFTATGSARLYYLDGNTTAAWYLVAGDVSIPPVLASDGATCTPDSASKSLADSIAEMVFADGSLRWGVNARWSLSCSTAGGESHSDAAATYFDSLGIALWSCDRTYVGSSVAGADASVATYLIECGVGETVTTSWSFLAERCGQPCTPSADCSLGILDCGSGDAVCLVTGPAPDGTGCGSSQVCITGVCV